MYLFLKISLIVISLIILYQDVTERKAYWFWFPLLIVLYSSVHLEHVVWQVFTLTSMLNLTIVGFFLLIIALYAKLKLRVNPRHVFGLGDALLFLALAFTFSTVSFITTFVFALVFALSIHVVFKKQSKFNTVPLAGYMSVFYAITYVAYWCNSIDSLYRI